MPWGDSQLVFAHIRSPQTVANVRNNQAMEINVVDPFTRKGYRFKGTAEIIEGGATFEQIMKMYRGDTAVDPLENAELRVKAFVLMTVHSAKPMISPAYDGSATEEEIVSKWTDIWHRQRQLV